MAFDLKAPTFRHKAYDGYKATRHPMPEELAMQMPLMKEVLGAMNIPIYECEGWEADDILGTVGEICTREGDDCVIVTGDRGFFAARKRARDGKAGDVESRSDHHDQLYP